MQNKSFDKWFRIYNYVVVGLSALLVVAFFFVQYVPSFMKYKSEFGLTIASTL